MGNNLKKDTPDGDTGTELARELGLGAAMSIGIGTMVCAGIFVLPGITAAKAGPIVVLAFALCGLVAVLIALCMSELSTGMPLSGGWLPVHCEGLRSHDGYRNGVVFVAEPYIRLGLLYDRFRILCGGCLAHITRVAGTDYDGFAHRTQFHRRQRDGRNPERDCCWASHCTHCIFRASRD